MSAKPIRPISCVTSILLSPAARDRDSAGSSAHVSPQQLPVWLQHWNSGRLNVPFSVCCPGPEWLRHLPVRFREAVGRIFCLPDPAAAGCALQQLAANGAMDPVSSGQCAIQAGMAFIDAGDPVRGWSVMQHAISHLTQLPAHSTTAVGFRTVEWLALASGALAVSDVDSAQDWLQQALNSFQQRQIANVNNSPAGQQAARPQSSRLMGDYLTLRSCLQLHKGDTDAAVTGLSTALGFHQDAGAIESAATDHALLAGCSALLGQCGSAHQHACEVRGLLTALDPRQTTFRTTVLWKLLAIPTARQPLSASAPTHAAASSPDPRLTAVLKASQFN